MTAGRRFDNCRRPCQEVTDCGPSTASSESLSDAKDGEVFNTEGSVEERVMPSCCRARIFVIAAEELSAASCRTAELPQYQVLPAAEYCCR